MEISACLVAIGIGGSSDVTVHCERTLCVGPSRRAVNGTSVIALLSAFIFRARMRGGSVGYLSTPGGPDVYGDVAYTDDVVIISWRNDQGRISIR